MIEVKREGGMLMVRGGPTSEEWVYVASPYGPRQPFVVTLPDGSLYTTGAFHYGNDIPAPLFTTIRNVGPEGRIAAADSLDDGDSSGLWVALDHGGFYTFYYHLNPPVLPVGSVVKRGGTVGVVGNTGVSTGPHLHFEMRLPGNKQIDSLGPEGLALLTTGTRNLPVGPLRNALPLVEWEPHAVRAYWGVLGHSATHELVDGEHRVEVKWR